MHDNYPELKGYTKRNLYRMKQFYETYKDNEFVTSLMTQISWTHNFTIFSRCKTMEEKVYYIEQTIKNNYSVRELDRQISSSYFERKEISTEVKLIDKNVKILDTYTLEFLDLPEEHSEKDLRKAIVKNLKDFILEIGKGFTFVGEEYRVQVGNEDFYIDLLFFNRDLNCLVAFELKIDKFKPSYVRTNGFLFRSLR